MKTIEQIKEKIAILRQEAENLQVIVDTYQYEIETVINEKRYGAEWLAVWLVTNNQYLAEHKTELDLTRKEIETLEWVLLEATGEVK
jgi:hypothetical protein